jgi:cytochrome c nitrite reductase small subunit
VFRFIKYILPPENWKTAVIILSGGFTGIVIILFYLSKANSYLGDNPETCVNCHIMGPQYQTWQHSAHRDVANCNDCHTPHNNIFNHYFFKAKDGMRHATIFTLRREPQVIFIKDAGRDVVHDNCKRCHQILVENIEKTKRMSNICIAGNERLCWDCHRETPHGRVNGLSSVPYARVPVPESPVPDWLKKLMK